MSPDFQPLYRNSNAWRQIRSKEEEEEEEENMRALIIVYIADSSSWISKYTILCLNQTWWL